MIQGVPHLSPLLRVSYSFSGTQDKTAGRMSSAVPPLTRSLLLPAGFLPYHSQYIVIFILFLQLIALLLCFFISSSPPTPPPPPPRDL